MRRFAIVLLLLAGCAKPGVAPYAFQPDTPAEIVLPETTTSTATTLRLSIEGATMRALSTNRDLAVQRYEPVIAGTFEAIERGVFDPELFAELRLRRERASQVARATGERFDVSGTTFEGAAGLRQRLPTGTTLEAIVEHDYDESNRTPRQQGTRLGLTITQSLLRGFGPAVNLATVRQAKLEFDASVHELKAFAEVLAMDTEIAYWTYAFATQEIEIYEESLALAEKQARDTRDRIEVGALAPIDAAATEAELARRKQGLIDARSRRDDAELRLARLVGESERLNVDLVATSDPRLASTPLDDVDERVQLALESRPDLKEAELRLAQQRLETVITRNGILPRLDVFVALGKTGFDSSTFGSVEALSEGTYDVVAGLDFSDFIGHRATQGIDRAARATRRQAEAAIANLRQLIAMDVRVAAIEVERAGAQIAASAVTRKFQEQAVVAEQERFDVGAGTALLVASAQRDLLSSRIDEVRAIVDYRIALVRLYRAEGSLLARRGVVVAER